ncbi:uncharacterized protein LOC122798556 [Protopterus annectens]|uniref:uncharacterized protein LOC122798556 n=1 Tax=Protopterus annectens TaxID=7888 RepID=UPI001CFB58F3|nr:uncharacterized protein LOC122798556 [Protopterus annectens]XP_043923546.1 uncharacterized protein LOC122798556 [Protopterus annectens]
MTTQDSVYMNRARNSQSSGLEGKDKNDGPSSKMMDLVLIHVTFGIVHLVIFMVYVITGLFPISLFHVHCYIGIVSFASGALLLVRTKNVGTPLAEVILLINLTGVAFSGHSVLCSAVLSNREITCFSNHGNKYCPPTFYMKAFSFITTSSSFIISLILLVLFYFRAWRHITSEKQNVTGSSRYRQGISEDKLGDQDVYEEVIR